VCCVCVYIVSRLLWRVFMLRALFLVFFYVVVYSRKEPSGESQPR
jgi:hypothetical protein